MTDWAMVKSHTELWKDMEPQYYYVQESIVENAEAENGYRYHARLVLETDQRGIFRSGDLADYPDVSSEDLNVALSEMIATERSKALAVCGFLLKHPEAVEERLDDLRFDAIETFSRMEEAKSWEMRKLNEEFYRLTEEERQIRYAFSLQNPWMLTFIQIKANAPLTHAIAIAAIDHIKVCAEVTDPAWLVSPIYPSAGRYNKGMKRVVGVRQLDGRVPRGAQGRKSRRKDALLYREPALTLTDIVPIPRFYRYRDYLPREWLEPRTKQEIKAADKARKEAKKCLPGLNDGTHIPCSLKKSKSRS